MLRREKGITLVALVITIIVLIILAAVSISAAMNTGLIENSKIAKNEYSAASANETLYINNVTDISNELINDLKTK